ncbi:sybindin-like family [Fusarium heterosporum]|uniref:Trafficking protein particle complex subunit n=1 Tax=Fusarium heterosporum TaxID=42747 RepID=A0A8H5TMV1_FUSHE|nr:sybindin-like family [Fusarium heterosporum]
MYSKLRDESGRVQRSEAEGRRNTHLTLISLTLVRGLSSGVDGLKQVIMTIFALIIINKAGGLVYNKNFAEGLQQISTNDYLVLAGTFHGVHAITSRLNPVKNLPGATPPGSRPEPPSGLEVLETENFRMQCFNTLTGVKFLLFTDTTQANVDVTIRKIYDLYADYVMKNPFYSLEMPVRCDIFDRKLHSYIREINNR